MTVPSYDTWTRWRHAAQGMRAFGIPESTVKDVGGTYTTVFLAYVLEYWRWRKLRVRPRHKHVLSILQVLVAGLGVTDTELLRAAVIFYADKRFLPKDRARHLASLAQRIHHRPHPKGELPSGIDSADSAAILEDLGREPDAVRLCLADEYAWMQSGLSRRPIHQVYHDISEKLLPIARAAGIRDAVDMWAPWLEEQSAKRLESGAGLDEDW